VNDKTAIKCEPRAISPSQIPASCCGVWAMHLLDYM
jgi:hypothetical protein